MIRNIILDEENWVGCGLCVSGCHQGAIKLDDEKRLFS